MMKSVYGAGPLKRRRATKAEMEERAEFLIATAREMRPIGVRGLYYQAETAGVPGIGKDDSDYDKIQRQVLDLRRGGRIPYPWISDHTRWMRKPDSYRNAEHALNSITRLYRKNLWQETEEIIEVWVEKDSVAGLIYEVTEKFDVPLMPTGGFSSETFAFEAVSARVAKHRSLVRKQLQVRCNDLNALHLADQGRGSLAESSPS